MAICVGILKWTFVLIPLVVCAGGCNGAPCEDLARSVLGALEGAVGFFAREYGEVNLDAVVGIRIAQSQLQSALTELDFEHNSKLKALRADIEGLSRKAGTVCDEAIPVVKRQYPKDYRDLGMLVSDNFWSTKRRTVMKRTDPSLSSPSRQLIGSETLSEPLTDKCISELLGTKSEPCRITSSCWNLMTPRGYRSYSLTHQILYFKVGAQLGCESHITKRFHDQRMATVNVNSLMDGFCSDVLREAEATADRGFPSGSQDLFMEQVLLCGLMGYEDFFKLPWLRTVLSWQDDSGCFTGEEHRPHADEIEKDESDYKETYDFLRERRREKEIKESGCLIHKTSVAVGLLSSYLRVLLYSMTTKPSMENCIALSPEN
ncbi:UPF0764 protein C16orf89 homolog [Asterias amurensis]|uniref:UPF0764 protein C16orf89 homolog n=1 Tax=Asterias amurensis TaxID=7602 RepID=UPI003AB8B58B